MEDLQAVGDITSVKDTGQMEMSFNSSLPPSRVRDATSDFMGSWGAGIDIDEDHGDEIYYISTNWKMYDLSGMEAYARGVPYGRTKYVFKIGPGTSSASSMKVEIFDESLIGGTWKYFKNRAKRNFIRNKVARIFLTARLLGHPLSLKNDTFLNYEKKRIRHGRKGYELPELVEYEYSRLTTTPPPESAPSIADELTKLKTLLDQGVLTPEEFEKAKSKLLEK